MKHHFSIKNSKTKTSINSENVEEALHPTVPNIEPRFNSLHGNKQTCPSHEYANLPLPLVNGKIKCRENIFKFSLDLFIYSVCIYGHMCMAIQVLHGMSGDQRQLEEVGLLVFPCDSQIWGSSLVCQTWD